MSSIIFPKDVLNIIAEKIADAKQLEHLYGMAEEICHNHGIDLAYCSTKGCDAYMTSDRYDDDPNIHIYNCYHMMKCHHCINANLICDKHYVHYELDELEDYGNEPYCVTCSEKLHIYK